MTGRLKSAWHALRGYTAASDLRASTWAPSAGSANTEVSAAATTVARRARDAVRNDPYASRILDLWTGNAVGAGITTRWPDDAHTAAWRRWSDSTACDAEGLLDLYGLQALAMRAVVESGECFIRLLPAEVTPHNPVGLRLQVLESDHLDASRIGTVEGLATLNGIALDEAGAPLAYWLFRRHPGAWWPGLPGPWASEPIPARDVLHLYRKRRPGQLRDVSWLAPVLTRLRDLGDYEAALLMKAKIEACLAAVVTDEGDEALTGAAANLLRDAQGCAVEAFEPGMILYRRGAGSVEVVNPSGGGSHAAFARRALEAAAVGAGLTYDQVSGAETRGQHRAMLVTLGAAGDAGDALWIPDTGLTQGELNERGRYGDIAWGGDEAITTRDSPQSDSQVAQIAGSICEFRFIDLVLIGADCRPWPGDGRQGAARYRRGSKAATRRPGGTSLSLPAPTPFPKTDHAGTT